MHLPTIDILLLHACVGLWAHVWAQALAPGALLGRLGDALDRRLGRLAKPLGGCAPCTAFWAAVLAGAALAAVGHPPLAVLAPAPVAALTAAAADRLAR